MRILYINKTFSGPIVPLAHYLARRKGIAATFIAERWPRVGYMPNIMRVRLPVATATDMSTLERAMESMAIRNIRNARHVADVCGHLHKKGFIPDVIYATAQDGYAQHLRDIFPDARIVVRMDNFFSLQALPASAHQDTPPQQTSFAYERLCNAFQLSVLAECTLGILSSQWQKKLLDTGFANIIRVLPNGVDTDFFTPDATKREPETIVVSCQGTHPDRDMLPLYECLPELLARCPRCRVRIVSFATRTLDHALLSTLSASAQARVEMILSPSLKSYVDILQRAALYVYLTPPSALSSGLLEAMSCGALVLASDTETVREIVRHRHNGILWPRHDTRHDTQLGLAHTIAELVAHAPEYTDIARQSRESMCSLHNARTLLVQHEALVLGIDG